MVTATQIHFFCLFAPFCCCFELNCVGFFLSQQSLVRCYTIGYICLISPISGEMALDQLYYLVFWQFQLKLLALVLQLFLIHSLPVTGDYIGCVVSSCYTWYKITLANTMERNKKNKYAEVKRVRIKGLIHIQ